MAAYAINEEGISDDAAFTRILNFGNDVSFLLPVLSYAHCWNGSAYVYHFNEPNVWNGPWKGHASHILDVAYLFQNYNEHLPAQQSESAVKFAEDLITFSNGEAPWPVFNSDTGEFFARVYGISGSGIKGRVDTVKGSLLRAGRRETSLELAKKVSSDDLSRAWNAFMAGL